MTPAGILFLIVGAGGNAAGSFFLKLLADGGKTIGLHSVVEPFFLLAGVSYVVSMFGYSSFLRGGVNLASGYPIFIGLTFVFVLLFSFIFLRETMTLPQIIGSAIIFVGIIVATR